jgi:hypothetical protein
MAEGSVTLPVNTARFAAAISKSAGLRTNAVTM